MIGGEVDTDTITAAEDAPAEAAPAADESAMRQRFAGTMFTEGEMSVDGRTIDPGASTWRDLPLTIYFLNDIPDFGHEGAVAVGSILTISRTGNAIEFTGEFDTSPVAQEAARLIGDGVISGVSVDMAPQTVEMRVRADLVDAEEPLPVESAAEGNGKGESDHVTVETMNSDDVVMAVTDGLIISATIVGQPAFTSGKIALTASATLGEVWQMHTGSVTLAGTVPPPEENDEQQGRSPAHEELTPSLDPLLLVAGVLHGLSEGALMGGVLKGLGDALTDAAKAQGADPLTEIVKLLEAGRVGDREQLAGMAEAFVKASERPAPDIHVHPPDVTVEGHRIDVHPPEVPVHLTVEGQKRGAMRLVHDPKTGRVVGSEPVPESEAAK